MPQLDKHGFPKAAHHCQEWDYMDIYPGTGEMECCDCDFCGVKECDICYMQEMKVQKGKSLFDDKVSQLKPDNLGWTIEQKCQIELIQSEIASIYRRYGDRPEVWHEALRWFIQESIKPERKNG